jgi:hypothetical protein
MLVEVLWMEKYFEVLKLIKNNVSRGIMDGLTM